MRAKQRLSNQRICEIGSRLDKSPASAAEIAYEIGAPQTWVGRVTRNLHLGNYVHVIAWRRKPTKREAYSPVYAAGPGEDAPHPKEAKKAQKDAESL